MTFCVICAAGSEGVDAGEPLAGDDLPEDHAQRPLVAPPIQGSAVHLFRGHVGRCARNRQSARLPAPKPRLLRFRRRRSGASNAKISDLQVSRCADQEIFRLDIAVTNQSPTQGMFKTVTEMSGIPHDLRRR